MQSHSIFNVSIQLFCIVALVLYSPQIDFVLLIYIFLWLLLLPSHIIFPQTDAPEFLNPPLTQFDIIEGQSNVFNQTARGNPSSINYKWKREDDSEIGNSGSRLNADGPILNVSNAQRSDSGIYKLYATNELGTSETSIRVNVQCKCHVFFLFCCCCYLFVIFFYLFIL